ncbi:MAG: nicotinamidase [Chloroflexota bacterium]
MGDALIVVDVQNDFCPGGTLAVAGGDQVVAPLNEYARRFFGADRPVFASRDWHPPVTKHFAAYGGAWPPHCVQGTEGALFHPDLALPNGSVVVTKGADPEVDAYSVFQATDDHGTPFPDLLRALGVNRVFVGGLATDYCVRATVLDAVRHGIRAVLLADAVRGVDVRPGDTERAIVDMLDAGAEVTTLAKIVGVI